MITNLIWGVCGTFVGAAIGFFMCSIFSAGADVGELRRNEEDGPR